MQPGAKGERRAADLPRKFKLRHYRRVAALAADCDSLHLAARGLGGGDRRRADLRHAA
jgi:hypothetical protein